MPIDLHQRLSEFSYGYGVTREVERLLRSVGLRSTPFLPNLLHEAKLGFDVAFDRPGAPLLLQFKLGEALQRFRRAHPTQTPPAPLGRPFWRFNIDTAEPDGQYDMLLKAEQDGAEVYYVAPRFTSWDRYTLAFEGEQILAQSLLVRPSAIDGKLVAQGEPDGSHRVLYDSDTVHVCSEPGQIEEVGEQQITNMRVRILKRDEHVGHALKRLLESFQRRREIRRSPAADREDSHTSLRAVPEAERLAPTPQEVAAGRMRRLTNFRARSERPEDAVFAATGFEAWAAGSQLLAVTLD